MNEAFFRGFTAETEKLGGIDPVTLQVLKRRLRALGALGLIGVGAVGGYKAIKRLMDTVEYETWIPARRR